MRTASKRRNASPAADPAPGKGRDEVIRADDPLYVIFEQHLYNFQDSDQDRKTFICNIIHEYLTHLRRMNIVVPKSLEQPIVEELYTQVNTMLVKKIYGCLTVGEYRNKLATPVKRRAQDRYQRLAAVAAPNSQKTGTK